MLDFLRKEEKSKIWILKCVSPVSHVRSIIYWSQLHTSGSVTDFTLWTCIPQAAPSQWLCMAKMLIRLIPARCGSRRSLTLGGRLIALIKSFLKLASYSQTFPVQSSFSHPFCRCQTCIMVWRLSPDLIPNKLLAH